MDRENWHTHTHTSATKEEETLPSTTWIDLVGIMLSEISQTEKDKYHSISVISGILKKKSKP